MKLGAENRNKVIASAILGGIALILIGRMLFTYGGSAPPPAAPSAGIGNNTSPAAVRVVKGGKVKNTQRSLDPSLRYDWLKASEETKYEGTGRNIFKAEAEIPQPLGNGTKGNEEAKKNQPTGPPPPPPPPPINLKFFGFASGPGEPKRIFLSQGEDVFIAAEGEIVDRHYKILHIAPLSVEVEDVLNNNRQSIPLTQG